MVSHWIGLAQIGAMRVSRCVALCRLVPEAVVTWFVTSFGASRGEVSLLSADPKSGADA